MTLQRCTAKWVCACVHKSFESDVLSQSLSDISYITFIAAVWPKTSSFICCSNFHSLYFRHKWQKRRQIIKFSWVSSILWDKEGLSVGWETSSTLSNSTSSRHVTLLTFYLSIGGCITFGANNRHIVTFKAEMNQLSEYKLGFLLSYHWKQTFVFSTINTITFKALFSQNIQIWAVASMGCFVWPDSVSIMLNKWS